MLHDELEDWFGPLRDDIEELNAHDFQELDQLNQIELHSLDVLVVYVQQDQLVCSHQ